MGDWIGGGRNCRCWGAPRLWPKPWEIQPSFLGCSFFADSWDSPAYSWASLFTVVLFIREVPPGLILHVLTVLVSGPGFCCFPGFHLGLGASDCSAELAFCFTGPWTLLGSAAAAPPPPMQKRDAQQMCFYSTAGHTPILAFLLTIGAFLLVVGALLLTIGAFLLTIRAFFAHSWSSFAYSGKLCLRSASMDCKQRSSTVSKTTPTVWKKLPPFFK